MPLVFIFFLILARPLWAGDPFLSGYRAYVDGRYREAIPYFDSIKDDSPLRDYGLYFKGLALFRAGRYEEVIEVLKVLLKDYPDTVFREEALLRMAEISLLEGDYGRVETILKDLKGARALYLRARAMERRGDLERAFEAYLSIWKDHPLEIGEVEEEMGDLEYRGLKIPISDRIKRVERLYERMLRAKRKGRIRDRIISELRSLGREGLKKDQILLLGRLSYMVGDLGYGERILKGLLPQVEGNERAEVLYYLSLICYRRGRRGCASDLARELLSFRGYRREALRLLARVRKDEGRFGEALAILEDLYREEPSDPEVVWELSWINYLLKRYDDSVRYLNILKGFPSMEERALYWLGRIALKRGENAHLLRGLASKGPSYYAFMARRLLHKKGRWTPPAIERDGIYKKPRSFTKAKALLSLGLKGLARREVLKALDSIKDPSSILEGIQLLEEIGAYYDSIGLAESLLERADGSLRFHLLRASYPRGYEDFVSSMARREGLDPLLVYAVIREESHFHPGMTSPVHATGLMQIIPSTASYIDRIKGYEGYDLFDPETNIDLGVTYLSQLLNTFDGDILLAIAAYNGGPGNVRRWLKRKGGLDIDEFIEEIPYDETRRYVKKVIKSYYIYSLIYRDG